MVVIDPVGAVAAQLFWTLYEGAFFILIGFAIAGVIHVLLDPERIVRHLGGPGLRPAVTAALLGAPIPLCSCGVLPTAMSLRRKGASRAATLSFLVTTPETGVDSLAITFAYFGPVLAIVRPLAAIATGLVVAAMSLGRPPSPPPADAEPVPHEHEHAAAELLPADVGESDLVDRLISRGRLAMRYAFVDLFDELGFWLALAIGMTALLAVLLPSDFFVRFVPGSFASMVVMVVLGVPLYVCASASTPLAALFVAKGATAGAALVFLLVGPATNAATVTAIARLFGRSLVRVYLGGIVGVAIAAGLLLDVVAPGLGQSVRLGQPAGDDVFLIPKGAAALALGYLLIASLMRTGIRPGLDELVANARAAAAWAGRLRAREVLRSRPVQALALLWIVSVITGGLVRVPVGHRAIVSRLGRVAGEPRAPGLAFTAPLVDRVELVRVDQIRERAVGYQTAPGTLVRESVPDGSLYVTADENVIDLHVEAQYRAADPVRYRLGVESPDALVAALVRARLVEAMTSRPIDSVYTDDRAELEAWLLRRVRRDAGAIGLGVEVLGVRLLDVHAPATVHDAFRDVASAHEDRLTTIHQANEYAVGSVTVARGEAEKTVLDAQAWASERLARAQGDAAAFTALAAEHARAPRLTEDRLYLEMAERVLPGARKVIRSTSGGPRGYELWLRSDGMPAVFPPGVSRGPAGRMPKMLPPEAAEGMP
jgi:hypothetical protein